MEQARKVREAEEAQEQHTAERHLEALGRLGVEDVLQSAEHEARRVFGRAPTDYGEPMPVTLKHGGGRLCGRIRAGTKRVDNWLVSRVDILVVYDIASGELRGR